MTKIIGISGWSGSGKTTVIEKLIRIFKNNYELDVCVIKHAHESFNIDHKGKDSFRFAEAGAKKILVSSRSKWFFLNNELDEEANLYDLIKFAGKKEIILVEGWKASKLKKIEIYRSEIKKPLLHCMDKNFIAIATNEKNFCPERKIDVLDLNNEQEIANFIINYKSD